MVTFDEENFWQFIAEAKAQSGKDGERQVQILVDKLASMSLEDIAAYSAMFDHLQDIAYQRELWTAASLITGGGNDGFMDFRAWLIAQGQEVFYAVLRDPDILADMVEVNRYGFGNAELENMNYVDQYAYEKKTGDEDMPRLHNNARAKLKGDWLDDEACEKFPKIMKKFSPGSCQGTTT
jgi:hypothetical protein